MGPIPSKSDKLNSHTFSTSSNCFSISSLVFSTTSPSSLSIPSLLFLGVKFSYLLWVFSQYEKKSIFKFCNYFYFFIFHFRSFFLYFFYFFSWFFFIKISYF